MAESKKVPQEYKISFIDQNGNTISTKIENFEIELIPGCFYWIKLDCFSQEEWEKKRMPARFECFHADGRQGWHLLNTHGVLYVNAQAIIGQIYAPFER
jgi:hypothetical protein